jgi:hypothetical protein
LGRHVPDVRPASGMGACQATRGAAFSVESDHSVERKDMEPERIYTHEDELRERRRRLAIIRPPIDLQGERLKRMKDRPKDKPDA